MKVNTDFGIQEIKPQKIFEWEGIKFAIIKRPEKYMGAREQLIMQRVIEYTTTQSLPINIQRGDTLKDIQQKAITLLSGGKIGLEELKRRIKEDHEQINS